MGHLPFPLRRWGTVITQRANMEIVNYYRNFILRGKTSSQRASLQVCFPAQSNLLGVNAVDVGSTHQPHRELRAL